MRVSNVNIWLLMMQDQEILGEKPESVSVEFSTNSENVILTAKFKEGCANSHLLVQDLEHLVDEEVFPTNNSWIRR